MQRPQTLVALAALTLVVLGITLGGAEASLIVFPTAALTDGINGFTTLDGARGVAIAQISDRTYAVITANIDDGVQIIDMTNPAAPVPVAEIIDNLNGFTTLDGARGVAIAQIFGRTYAVIAAEDDDGVQIIDMTNPAAPVPVAEIIDNLNGFTTLDGARGVAIAQIFGRTYAVIAAEDDDGVQIIDMTNPAAPVPVAEIIDNLNGFTTLDGAHEIAITKIFGKPYAVVAARHDDGVQIIDMTNPAAPTPTAALTDGINGFTTLDGARDVAIAQISDRTYAVITANIDDGVQIIDMTNPAAPVPVAEIIDNLNGFTTLDGARDVAIAQISDRTYAVITANIDDGVQIIDMTNPATPVPVAEIIDNLTGFTTLDGAHGVAIAQISDRTYAAVVAKDDDGVQIIDITGTTITAHRSVDVLVYGYNDGARPITAGHIELLESRGYVVEVSGGPVAAEQMERASVVVGWSLNVQDAEARNALEEYVYGGGRLLLLLDTQYATCGTEEIPCWYDFTKGAFGFKFDGDVQNGVLLPAEGSERHPIWNSPNILSEFSDWCCDAYVGEITDAQNVQVLATVSGQSYKLGKYIRVQDVPAIVVNNNPAWGGGMVVGTGIDMVMGLHGPDMRMFDNLIEFTVSGGKFVH